MTDGPPRIFRKSHTFLDRIWTGVDSHTTFLDLLRRVTMRLRESQTHTRAWVRDLALFANGLYALDDTTLDALMRRTPSLKKHPKGAMETLRGRLSCALDIVTGKFAEVLYDPDSKANEKTHARPLIERTRET